MSHPSNDQAPERFTLVFEALPDDVPVAVRLRHLLKFALRGLRLRCVTAQPVPTARPDEDKT